METKKLDFLINYLISENEYYKDLTVPDDPNEKFRMYRSLVNIRPAKIADEKYLAAEDDLLKEIIARRGITDIADLTPAEDGIYLWQGDITTLKCGAVVNAANAGMTGCYIPCHNCIDNCIHTFAGVRLRYECQQLMTDQGYSEPTGGAKITDAYNLPCGKIIHTVGPIVDGALNDEHCRLLESCYQNCLRLAVHCDIDSIAFCCISTGVFGFPQRQAAQIAVRTVRKFRENHDISVIFNVFNDDDCAIYKELLG